MKYILKKLSKSSTEGKLVSDIQIQCLSIALGMLQSSRNDGVSLAKNLLLAGSFGASNWARVAQKAANAEKYDAKELRKLERRLPKLQYEVQKYTEALEQSKKVKAEDRIERFTKQLALDSNAVEVCKLDIVEAKEAVDTARLRTAVVKKIGRLDKDGPVKVVDAVYQFLSPEKAEEYIQRLAVYIHEYTKEQAA